MLRFDEEVVSYSEIRLEAKGSVVIFFLVFAKKNYLYMCINPNR